MPERNFGDSSAVKPVHLNRPNDLVAYWVHVIGLWTRGDGHEAGPAAELSVLDDQRQRPLSRHDRLSA
jgi:hypothetical protein